ncbi:MAG: hypothetical protein ACSHX7_14870 [Luteolibacter sp.]
MKFQWVVQRLSFVIFVSVVVSSCAYLPRSKTVPVRMIEEGDDRAEELVVFLPGRWSTVGEFQREGFLQIASERWPGAKLVVPDLHLGYYKDNSMVDRLHEDVILPARKNGVKTVRIVGVSMGGMGAVVYSLLHPGEVDELMLLAPFLGEEAVISEIKAAGKLEDWKPGNIAEKDFSRKIWKGLKEEWMEGGEMPRVLLGCGEEDRLVGASQLLSKEFLKKGEQVWIPGGHDWPVWRELFEKMIEK